MLSILLPVRNEYENLDIIEKIFNENLSDISYEAILINDFSTDNTLEVIKKLIISKNQIAIYENKKKGLGGAITEGINKANGEAICIMMSDLSDSMADLENYYNIIKENDIDAVFGSRFINGSKVIDYPKKKLMLNRIFNIVTKLLFISDYSDFTNAFKIYKKSALLRTFPLVSESFNIFLELPLKIISRKMKYKIIPISWINRKEGNSKFDIKELRAKYLFTLIYCLIEKLLLKK